jgi:hypothetical protein
MLKEIWPLLQESEVAISPEDLTFINQLIFGYLTGTEYGKVLLAVMLSEAGIRTKAASYMKTYFKDGFLGMEEGKLNIPFLKEIHCWLYGNPDMPDKCYVVPFEKVETVDLPDSVGCDDCSARTPIQYCNQTVKEWSNGKEMLLNLCNRCRLHKVDPKIRDTASTRTCMECPMKSCQYHPLRGKDPQEAYQVQRNFEMRQTARPPQTAAERYGVL